MDTVMGGDGARMELIVSHKSQDFLELKRIKSSESRLLGFSNLVSVVWGKRGRHRQRALHSAP